MSATEILKGISSSEETPLPRIYADRAMPLLIIAGTPRLLAWNAHRVPAVAAER